MGYLTNYQLTSEAFNNPEVFEKVFGELEKRSSYTWWEDGDEIVSSGAIKWYDHSDDMRYISKKFPNIKFVLYGQGEEYDDIWVEYFVNGKSQHEQAVITLGDFDPQKLS